MKALRPKKLYSRQPVITSPKSMTARFQPSEVSLRSRFSGIYSPDSITGCTSVGRIKDAAFRRAGRSANRDAFKP
jgi:hypothetical protein